VARQLAFLAQRFISAQDGFQFAFLLFAVAVLHGCFPVTGLLLNVKGQTSRATNGLQTRSCALDDIATVVITGLKTEPFTAFAFAEFALETIIVDDDRFNWLIVLVALPVLSPDRAGDENESDE